MLSRLVITFLPRTKHLLISWLQSPSAVILKPKKIKSVTVSIVSPSICHEAMRPYNHTGVITHLEPDILECEVKRALASITRNKASGGDGIPVELFHILKDDAVKVLYSKSQKIWETQQWPKN